MAQSVRMGFGALRIVTMFLALAWACSNIRPVPPDTQAVVLRLGQVVRVQQSGLALALPRPFEAIDLLPGPERQLSLKMEASSTWGEAIAVGETVPTSTLCLTGDEGVVILDGTLTYRISDAAAYYLAADHVAPALRRLFLAAATRVAARRVLDDFIVVRGSESAQSGREQVRGELAATMNRRLAELTANGASFGVTVSRVDLTPLLPPKARFAFDAVLQASQVAEQGLAAARTQAERARQEAGRNRDRILDEAHASAEERVRGVQAQIATVTALQQRAATADRAGLLEQAYRDRVAQTLRHAGDVTTIDPQGGVRLLMPGVRP